MDTTFGCECRCHGAGNQIPVAFIINRKGHEIKVCTKCDLSSDVYVARLFDKDTLLGPFIEHDALGAFCIAFDAKMSSEAWLEYRNASKKVI